MARLIACLLSGAAVLAFAGGAHAGVETHLSDLAACAHSPDQAICLLKLAKRENFSVPAADLAAFAYSPDVVAVINTPPEDSKFRQLLSQKLARPERAAADALLADRDGASPQDALAKMQLAEPDGRGRPPDHGAFAQAYAAIVVAACQAIAPDRNHQPSAALVTAALERWKAEEAANDWTGAYVVIEPCVRAGRQDIVRSIVSSLPRGTIQSARTLVDAGFPDEAARSLTLIASGKSPRSELDVSGASELVPALVKAGHADAVRLLAESTLGRAQPLVANLPASDGLILERGTVARFSASLRAAVIFDDVQVIGALADNGLGSEARHWAARFDNLGRDRRSVGSGYLAAIAVAGWNALDEPGRSADLAEVWRRAAGDQTYLCRETTPECVAAHIVLLLNAVARVDDHAAFGPMPHELSDSVAESAMAEKLCRSGHSEVPKPLVDNAWTAESKAIALQACAVTAVKAGNLDLAANAETRRAAFHDGELHEMMMSISNGSAAVSNALFVASAAADAGRVDVMHRMLDLAYQVAGEVPTDKLDNFFFLQKIGVAELREQGRL